ncbi:hypothetical protein HanRHA438_Chr17g0830871 [Helianthus annuus]|nr:hypothetical protein HanRHA438_Chr17g0830871 [Helianthus annuus]
MPASARANVAAFMQADLVPDNTKMQKNKKNKYLLTVQRLRVMCIFSYRHLLEELAQKCRSVNGALGESLCMLPLFGE